MGWAALVPKSEGGIEIVDSDFSLAGMELGFLVGVAVFVGVGAEVGVGVGAGDKITVIVTSLAESDQVDDPASVNLFNFNI